MAVFAADSASFSNSLISRGNAGAGALGISAFGSTGFDAFVVEVGFAKGGAGTLDSVGFELDLEIGGVDVTGGLYGSSVMKPIYKRFN